MQLGYFQVMDEPVSTCVHEIFESAPAGEKVLGWQPDDVIDNRPNVFPFSGTFYAPSADHAGWRKPPIRGEYSRCWPVSTE